MTSLYSEFFNRISIIEWQKGSRTLFLQVEGQRLIVASGYTLQVYENHTNTYGVLYKTAVYSR